MSKPTITLNTIKLINRTISDWATAGQYGDDIIIRANGATEGAAKRNIGSALMAIGDGDWSDADIETAIIDQCDDIFDSPADPNMQYSASIVIAIR